MQMNEQVLTALEVLRNFAENDFERHRIDVLEKDLTAPPVAEQIDDTHQKFNGVTYLKSKSGHYIKNQSIHQAVYRYYCGETPVGYEIHHDDLNKGNNSIANLILLTPKQHREIHNRITCLKNKICICQNCGKSYENSVVTNNNRFCSKKCFNQWHKIHKTYHEVRICAYCGKEFEVNKHSPSKTCSTSCGRMLLYKDKPHKRDNPEKIVKVCAYCGKEFETRKWTKTRFCSISCSNAARWKDASTKTKKCAFCGKEFEYKSGKKKFCSESCRLKARYQSQKNNTILFFIVCGGVFIVAFFVL